MIQSSALQGQPDRQVSQAWHHTNTELPWHLPVTPTLTDVLRVLR